MPLVTGRKYALARSAFGRGFFLAVLWWILSEGEAASWGIGAITVVIATAVSLALSPSPLPRVRLLPLLRFVPFFIVKSFLGGVDMVRRACLPVVNVAPAIKTCRLAKMTVAERVTFTIIFGLFPGTLSVRLEGETLRFHVLDEAMPVMEEIAALEQRLAPIFGRTSGKGASEHQVTERSTGGEQ